MTEEEMQKKIVELAPMVKGKKAKGLDCAGFDRFVDELVRIFLKLFRYSLLLRRLVSNG